MDDRKKQMIVALLESATLIAVTVLAHPDIKREWQMRFYRACAEHARSVAERAGRVAIAAEQAYNALCGG